ITFRFPPEVIDLTITGEVLEVQEPHVLSFTWGEETLRFELFEEGEGTRLVLVDELPAHAAARNAAGWDTCLDRLAGLRPPEVASNTTKETACRSSRSGPRTARTSSSITRTTGPGIPSSSSTATR